MLHPVSLYTGYTRSSTLFGFVNAYFSTWRTFPDPERMETLIQEVIREKCQSNKTRVLAKWNSSPFLFTHNADKHLGRILVRDRLSIAKLCTDHFIGENTNLARRAADSALMQAVNILLNRPKDTPEAVIMKEMNWIKENLLGGLIDAGTYRDCMGKLILSDAADRHADVKQLITDFVIKDNRLGDPRLRANEPNWRNMSVGARERVLSWFATKNIEFFFNAIVNDENRRRAEFWLRFARRPNNIKDFQAAISDDDEYKVRRAARDIG